MLRIKYIDVNGDEQYIYPETISAKQDFNSATELTITIPNKSGMNSDILVANDIVEIEEVP